MKKIISLALALIMLLGVVGTLASCGGDTEVAKVIDIALSEEEYAFAVAQDDAELLAQVNDFMAKIKANGKFDQICNNYFGDGTPFTFKSATLDTAKDQLVVATSTGFEPFEMVDANGNYSGIDLEIAYYLAQELGKELVIMDMDFDSVVNSVAGIGDVAKCDIAMAGLTVTPARAAVVNFTNSYYNASQVLIVKADDTTFDGCKTAEDVVAILNQMPATAKIGCQQGTTGEIYINGDIDDPDGYGFAGLTAEAASYKYVALAVTAMTNGQVTYVIADNAPAKAITAKMNGN